jgi:exodeoxyribonuclease-5
MVAQIAVATRLPAPTDEQWAVVRRAINFARRHVAGSPELSPFIWIAGLAGTGKTTLVPHIILESGIPHDRIAYLTVGHKANRVGAAMLHAAWLTEVQCRTIHSLLFAPPLDHDGNLIKGKDGEIPWIIRGLRRIHREFDLLIVDEASMVGSKLADLLRETGLPIIAIGDHGQLPPVKDGAGFAAGQPDYLLKTVHRQAWESPILRAAYGVREGKPLRFERVGNEIDLGPFLFQEAEYSPSDAREQAIVGMNRTRWQVINHIRAGYGFDSYLPMPGEKGICRATSYELGDLFNAEPVRFLAAAMGFRDDEETAAYIKENGLEKFASVVSSIMVGDEDGRPKFPFPVNVSTFHFEQAERQRRRLPPLNDGDDPLLDTSLQKFVQLDFDHAITCHQAQGSQYERVVVYDDMPCQPKDYRMRWLYTAFTRARRQLVVRSKALK